MGQHTFDKVPTDIIGNKTNFPQQISLCSQLDKAILLINAFQV